MDANIQKALWLGIGILLFISVVALGMTALNKGKQVTESSMAELDKSTRMLSNAAYTSYDGHELSGDAVIAAIRAFKSTPDEIQITVKVSGGTTTTYLSTGTPSTGSLSAINKSAIDAQVKAAQNKNSATTYINPYGRFYSTLIYDANDVVRGITIEQE